MLYKRFDQLRMPAADDLASKTRGGEDVPSYFHVGYLGVRGRILNV